MQLLERDYDWGNRVSSCEECTYTIQYLQVTGSWPLANETQLLFHNEDLGNLRRFLGCFWWSWLGRPLISQSRGWWGRVGPPGSTHRGQCRSSWTRSSPTLTATCWSWSRNWSQGYRETETKGLMKWLYKAHHLYALYLCVCVVLIWSRSSEDEMAANIAVEIVIYAIEHKQNTMWKAMFQWDQHPSIHQLYHDSIHSNYGC